jgi:hypothetical protein
MLHCNAADEIQNVFVQEFLDLNIQQGTRIRSVTGTVRTVVNVLLNEGGCPEGIITRIEGVVAPHQKTVFTLTEVILGFRKCLAEIDVPLKRMFQ